MQLLLNLVRVAGLGFLGSLSLAFLILVLLLQADKDACERKHNVYECEMTYVPKTGQEETR